MNTSPNTEMHFDRSALKDCAEKHHDLPLIISRALPAPSPAMLSEMVRRTFQRNLELPSLSGNGQQNTVTATTDHVPDFLEIRYEGCTVYFAKMVCASFSKHAAALSMEVQRFEAGDIVILESLDLSTGHCFPYHSAFERFQEILSLYQRAIGHPTTSEELKFLSDAISSDVIIQMGIPVKLQGDQRSLPVSVLESIRPCVAKTNMISMDEFDTVAAELNRIGQGAQVSIQSFTVNRILYTL